MAKTLETSVEISGVLSPSLQAAIKEAVSRLEEMSSETLAAAGAAEKLAAEITTQESVLKSLQRGYADFVVSGEEGTEEAQQLTQQIQELSSELNENRETLEAAQDAARKFASGMEEPATASEQLQATIKEQENTLQQLQEKYVNLVLAEDDTSDESQQLAQQIQELSSELNENRGTLEAAQDAARKFASDMEEPATASEQLQATIKEQENTLQKLKERYVALALSEDDTSDESRELAQQIQSLSGELSQNKQKLSDAEQAANELDRTLEQVDDSAELANEGFTVFKATLANLAADAIRSAIRGLKNLTSSIFETGMGFDTAVSQIAATMGLTVDQIGNLEAKAKEMGATTAFTATQAAEGLNILAMSGLDAEAQISTIKPVLDLASAGALDLADSASYVTGAVKGFSDNMDNAEYYADLMAKGATLANTDVSALGEALSQTAATSASYGQKVDKVTLSLLRLAEQNVTGSNAATALNRAMADIYTPTDSAEKALKSLGISAYTTSGKARDFNTVADELASKLSKMSDEEANTYKNAIFTAQGLSAFNKITVSSTQTVEKFTEGLSDVAGAAAQQAAT